MSAVAALERRDPSAPSQLPPPAAAPLLRAGAPHGAALSAPDESALMGQVLSLRARLRAVEGALDCLRSAVFVLDAGAAVLFANRPARGLLDDADALVLHGRRLTAAINGDAVRLREAVAGLAANGATDGPHAARTLTIRRRSDRPSLLAVALPAASSERQGGRPGEVLLFVADPGAFGSAAASLLRDAFGLTGREASVALATVRLGSLPAAAAELGVALTTARSHLQHVFDKIGARNQVALAQMLAALGALPAGRDEA